MFLETAPSLSYCLDDRPPPPALSEGPGSASEYRAKIVQGIPINCLNATGQAASCRQYYCQTVKITMIVDGANVSDK